MLLEIHKPELEERVRRQIQTGEFQDLDDLLMRALDALEGRMRPAVAADAGATGAVVLAALQASPYPDIDLTSPSVPLNIVRDVEL